MRVFVSATTVDLGEHRNVVNNRLCTHDIQPVTQENFGPDYQELGDFLRATVRRCDAVICLIGSRFGAAPSNTKFGPYSYTQLEYRFAREFRKPVFIAILREDIADAAAAEEEKSLREQQAAHRQEIMNSDAKYFIYESIDDLKVYISDCIPKLFSIAGKLPFRYLHPPPSPSFFAGRVQELKQIRKYLYQKTPSLIAVIGMPGQGKTTLVHKAIGELPQDSHLRGFWCTSARGGFSFDMFLDEALDYLARKEAPPRAVSAADSRVSELLKSMQDVPTLIVIDGIERWLTGWAESDIADGNSPISRETEDSKLNEFLSSATSLANGSHVIITSRVLPRCLDNMNINTVPVNPENEFNPELEGLSSDAAIKLLRHCGTVGSDTELSAVAESYECHPLALILFSFVLRKRYGGAIDNRHKISLLEPGTGLHALLTQMHEHLPDRTLAVPILQSAACFEENATIDLLTALCDAQDDIKYLEDELRVLAADLNDWNLISWEPASGSIRLHPLVKQYFTTTIDSAHRHSINLHLSKLYEARSASCEPRTLTDAKDLVLSIKHAARAGQASRCVEIMHRPVRSFDTLIGWLSDNGFARTAVDICTDVITHCPLSLHSTLLRLNRANCLHLLGRPASALNDVTLAVEFLDDSNGGTDIPNAERNEYLGQALACRGSILREVARSTDALPDLNRAIELFRKGTGLHSDLAKTLANRASVHQDLGSLSSAQTDYQEAAVLLSFGQSFSAESIRIVILASIMKNQASVLLERGQTSACLRKLDDAFEFTEQLDEQNRNRYRQVLAGIEHTRAMAFQSMNKIDESIEIAAPFLRWAQKQVASGREDLEPLYGSYLLLLSELYLVAQRYAEAVDASKRCIALYNSLVSAGERQYTGSLANALSIYACLCAKSGQADSAISVGAESVDLFESWIAEWAHESDVRNIFLKSGARLAVTLYPIERTAATNLLDRVLLIADEMRSGPGSTESSRACVFLSSFWLPELIRNMPLDPQQASSVRQLTVTASIENMPIPGPLED